jgi:hypothetical protein
MREFAPEEKLRGLKQRLAVIDRGLVQELEFEYFLIPFSHVVQGLARRGIYIKGGCVQEAIAENY